MLHWKDLPKEINCFVKCDTDMIDYANGKVVDPCFAGTKIVVVQKCTTRHGTIYRTKYARDNNLDWALKATDLGLPNDVAPLVHTIPFNKSTWVLADHTPKRAPKTKTATKSVQSPDSGEVAHRSNWLKNLFRRKNG